MFEKELKWGKYVIEREEMLVCLGVLYLFFFFLRRFSWRVGRIWGMDSFVFSLLVKLKEVVLSLFMSDYFFFFLLRWKVFRSIFVFF